jgi:hypothetical protein
MKYNKKFIKIIYLFLFSEFLATQNKQFFWSLINDVSSFDLFSPDARMRIRTYFALFIDLFCFCL